MAFYNERYLVAESVARVLAVGSALITRLDLIIVDDGSTDGRGAAVATGIVRAQGDVTLIHDADLEYNPDDLPRLLCRSCTRAPTPLSGRAFGRPTAGAFYISVSKLLTGLCDIDPSDEPLVAGEAGAGLSRGGRRGTSHPKGE